MVVPPSDFHLLICEKHRSQEIPAKKPDQNLLSQDDTASFEEKLVNMKQTETEAPEPKITTNAPRKAEKMKAKTKAIRKEKKERKVKKALGK